MTVRRASRAALAITAGLLALGTAMPGPVGAVPSPGPGGPLLPITVQLRSLLPLAPQPGDTVVVSATLRNTSSETVQDLDASLRYRTDRVGSRSEFDDYATTVTGPLPPRRASAGVTTLPKTTLGPGASEDISIRVPVDTLGLDNRSWQVYEIGIEVSGTVPTGSQTVGRLRTFLPWAPTGVPGVGLPTQVAWVLPLADKPHRLVGGTWLDDDLAAALTPDGRLGKLLAAGAAAEVQRTPPGRPRTKLERQKHIVPKQPPPVSAVPVTWAVDPMLVQDATRMAAGYDVTTGRTTAPGRGKEYAKAWLAGLKTAASHGQVLALPYADPDIVAATRNGLASEVQVAINSGQTLLESALGTTPLTYAWPPGGQIDQRTLDTMFAAGVRTVVLDSSALPIQGGEPAETPGAHAVVRARDGNLDALLADDGLRAVIDAGMANPSLQALAVQRFLSELLMIQAELPSDQRALVVAPDHRWAPDPAYAAALLADTGKVPWIQPIPLSIALDNPVPAKVVRQPLAYPASARFAELSPPYLAQVRQVKDRADAFASILTVAGDSQAREFDEAVLRTVDSAWRDDPIGAGDRLTGVRNALASTMQRVRIATGAGSFVTLTSHSGTVPVTVSNELDTPVRVVVKISSQHLKLSGSGGTAQEIPPHRRIPIDVKATAQTSGVFRLDVTLETPTGQVYQQVRLFVRSTAYGTVALLITGGATAVLFVTVAIRLIRRALRARRRAAAAAA